MKRQAYFCGLALGLVGLAAGLIQTAPGSVAGSRTGILDSLPMTIDAWAGSAGAPAQVLPPDPGAGEELARTYRSGEDVVWVSVGYYPDQRQGRRPAARALVFRGRGWTTLSERAVAIPLNDGSGRSLAATAVDETTPERRVATVYWYQLGGRNIASDHWYRALLIYERLVHGRAAGAFVRVAWPLAAASDGAPTPSHESFIRSLYSRLVPLIAAGAKEGPS